MTLVSFVSFSFLFFCFFFKFILYCVFTVIVYINSPPIHALNTLNNTIHGEHRNAQHKKHLYSQHTNIHIHTSTYTYIHITFNTIKLMNIPISKLTDLLKSFYSVNPFESKYFFARLISLIGSSIRWLTFWINLNLCNKNAARI